MLNCSLIRPCAKYAKMTCILRYMYQHFIDKYSCHIVLNSKGTHLKDLELLEKKDINLCNVTIHKMFKEQYDHLHRDFSKFCPSKQACNQTKYSINIRDDAVSKKYWENTQIDITYTDPIVEYR